MQEREFEELLWKARNKDKKAVFEIIEMYRPLLLKYAKVMGNLMRTYTRNWYVQF